jgi:membrane protein
MPIPAFQRWLEKIKQSRLVERCRRLVLPGFDNMPIYDVALFFIDGLKKGYIVTRASALSFKFFLSLFPALIFLFTLIPFIPIDNFQEELMTVLMELLPSNVYDLTQSTIEDLLTTQRSGLLSFGFILALYLATNGIDAMFNAFNESIHISLKNNLLRRKWMAFLVLLILVVLVILAITLIVGVELSINHFLQHHNNLSVLALQLGKWLVIVGLYFFAFSFIYYLGSHKTRRYRFISAGSTLATSLSLFLSLCFTYYVNHFGNYNKLYGSIGTLIVVLLWIYFNSLVLLIGYELNASIHQAQQSKKQ